MSAIPKINKLIAETAVKSFGTKPEVTRYWDDDHKSFVNLLECQDSPQEGVVSFSTVTLSDHPLVKDGDEYPTRVEIVGACGTTFKHFDNALATAAFNIINSKWFCYPGAVFNDVLRMYKCSQTMDHLLFVPPFLWEPSLQTIEDPARRIAWLQAVPISETELRFAEENGSDKLEDLFEEKQIDVFDLERPSVL